MDPESLQKENDKGIEALGERVSMLRNVSEAQRGLTRGVMEYKRLKLQPGNLLQTRAKA